MAVVRNVVPGERSVKSLQPTEVECYYLVGETDGRRVVQLDTFGSRHRDQPGKQSQTLQFTESSAKALWLLLGKEFGFK